MPRTISGLIVALSLWSLAPLQAAGPIIHGKGLVNDRSAPRPPGQFMRQPLSPSAERVAESVQDGAIGDIVLSRTISPLTKADAAQVINVVSARFTTEGDFLEDERDSSGHAVWLKREMKKSEVFPRFRESVQLSFVARAHGDQLQLSSRLRLRIGIGKPGSENQLREVEKAEHSLYVEFINAHVDVALQKVCRRATAGSIFVDCN